MGWELQIGSSQRSRPEGISGTGDRKPQRICILSVADSQLIGWLLNFYLLTTSNVIKGRLPTCVCLLLFYLLATSKVISGRVLTCDSVHSSQLYSAASLGHQATGHMTCYPSQSHYPVTQPTSPCFILIMTSARLGSDRYHI